MNCFAHDAANLLATHAHAHKPAQISLTSILVATKAVLPDTRVVSLSSKYLGKHNDGSTETKRLCDEKKSTSTVGGKASGRHRQ